MVPCGTDAQELQSQDRRCLVALFFIFSVELPLQLKSLCFQTVSGFFWSS